MLERLEDRKVLEEYSGTLPVPLGAGGLVTLTSHGALTVSVDGSVAPPSAPSVLSGLLISLVPTTEPVLAEVFPRLVLVTGELTVPRNKELKVLVLPPREIVPGADVATRLVPPRDTKLWEFSPAPRIELRLVAVSGVETRLVPEREEVRTVPEEREVRMDRETRIWFCNTDCGMISFIPPPAPAAVSPRMDIVCPPPPNLVLSAVVESSTVAPGGSWSGGAAVERRCCLAGGGTSCCSTWRRLADFSTTARQIS